MLKRRGAPARRETLPAADFAFTGRAKGGGEIAIGIERKKIPDILQCIQDGRFAGHQLPRLIESFDVRWLVVEGSWKNQPAEVLEMWLSTMIYKGGLLVWKCWGDEETADFIVRQYNWWCCGKGWDGHHSHLALHKMVDESIWEKQLNQVGRTAASLPGMGQGKARQAQEYFRSVKGMVNAPISSWRRFLGVADTIRVQEALTKEEVK